MAFCTEDAYHENVPQGFRIEGRSQLGAFYESFLDAFPDYEIGLDGRAYGRDQAVTWGSRRGTHLGEFMGVEATARPFPLRTLQEWMGHEDAKTTAVYADYAPSPHERELIEQAFRGPIRGPNLSETEGTSGDPKPHKQAESDLG